MDQDAQSAPDTGSVEDRGAAELADSRQAELRQRLHARFDAWLDRMLAGEAGPDGIPPELIEDVATHPGRECDLYTVFASLTGLTGEIRLQGRAFKQLTDALAPLSDVSQRLGRLEELQALAADQLGAIVGAQEQAQEDAAAERILPDTKAVLDIVFDLHGRLQRQLQTLQRAEHVAKPDGAMARMFAGGTLRRTAAATADAREGCRLMLARLEAALHQWGIEPIGRLGDMFDPEAMTAIEIQIAPDAEDGTVLEVYRLGYALCGRPLCTAQVKVARRADAQE